MFMLLSMFPVVLVCAVIAWAYIRPRFFVVRGIKNVPGPPPSSVIFGNLDDIWTREIGLTHRDWFDQHGPIVRYTSLFGEQVLVLGDAKALNQVLRTNAYNWPKSPETRTIISRLLGKGLIWSEGDDHKRLKRCISSAFSPGALRGMIPTFLETAERMCEIWSDMIDNHKNDPKVFARPQDELLQEKVKDEAVIDASVWTSRFTLDLIGLAGFGTHFDSLGNPNGPLATAFRGLHPPTSMKPSALGICITTFATQVAHWLSWIPIESIQICGKLMNRVNAETSRIVSEKRQERREAKAHGEDKSKRDDLITLLLKSNEGEGKHALTDAEVEAQMATMSLAGHDTTANAMTLMLYRLARHKVAQDKLRSELLEAREKYSRNGRQITAEELDSLPYLNAFIRESMRLESSFGMTARIAAQRDVLPLTEPILGRDGKTWLTEIVVEKGQQVIIPIVAYNRSRRWGPDVDDFKPERWFDEDRDSYFVASPISSTGPRSPLTPLSPISATSPLSPVSPLSPLSPKTPSTERPGQTGVFGNILTFLAGTRACIGWKFALFEMKVLLYETVPRFEFNEREPGMPISRRTAIVTRTVIQGEEHLGTRLPLRIRKID